MAVFGSVVVEFRPGAGPLASNGADWVDVTGRLRSASWSTGRNNEFERFPPGQATLTLDNRDRHLDPEFAGGPWFGLLQPRTPFRLRPPGAGPFGPVEVRGVSSVETGTTGSTIVPAPANEDGDQLLAFHSVDVGSAAEMTISGGWTEKVTSSTGVLTKVWQRVAAGEPASYTVGQNAGADGVITIIAASGVDTSVLPFAATEGSNTAQHFVDTPSTPGDRAFELRWASGIPLSGQAGALTNNWVSPEGFDERASLNSADFVTGALATRSLFDAGPTGVHRFTVSEHTDGQNPRTGITVNFATLPTAATHYVGFVESGFEQVYRPPADAECVVGLTDLLEVLQGIPLPATAYEAEVLADGPVAFWQLSETEGLEMGDSSGNGHVGVFDGGKLDQDPLIVGGGGSFFVPQSGSNHARFQGEGLPTDVPLTLEAWVRIDRIADPGSESTQVLLAVQRDFTSGFAVLWAIPGDATAAGGVLLIEHGGEFRAVGDDPVADGRIHHVVYASAGAFGEVQEQTLYVDGRLQVLDVLNTTDITGWPSFLAWSIGNVLQTGPFGLNGEIAGVAVYDYPLSASQVAVHHDAGSSGFGGERAGARIRRVLDIIGVPDHMWDIADGDTTVGPASYGGRSAGDYLGSVAESEQGFWHVDHRNDGRLRFRGRYDRFTAARSTTVQAAYTLDGAGLRYKTDGLEVDPNGIDSVVNEVSIRWPGGTVRVADADSVDRFGPQSRTLTVEAPSRRVAASAGEWLVARYAQPQVRVRGLSPVLGASAEAFEAAVVQMRPSDLITVERHPLGLDVPIVNEVFVEGVTNRTVPGRWDTDVRLSSADLGQVWIWGTSTWGETTFWG